MSGHRVQVTVFLEPEVHRAAKQRSNEMKLSLSATVAEAAKESLLSSYRSDREKEILKATERNFFAVRRLEQRVRVELQVLKELIGLGMRSFFNHIPPIPDSGKAAALLSGKQRFLRYLDMVASNLRGGDSVLGDVPLSGPDEMPSDADQSEAQKSEPPAVEAAKPDTNLGKFKAEHAHAPPGSNKSGVQDIEGQIGLFDNQTPKGSHGT